MILNVNSGFSNLLVHYRKPCSFRSNSSAIAGIHHSGKKIASLYDRGFHGTFPKIKPSASLSLGTHRFHRSAAPTPLLHREHGSFLSPTLPKLPKCPRRTLPPRASKDVPQGYRFPPMTKKPRWWWRTLACLPYLMPLHETWMFAQTAYNLHHFLECLQYLTYPFLATLGRLPRWSIIAYFIVAYLAVVRRREWPHFFRFHVVMGMLLEIAFQTAGVVSRWMPLAWYWGKIGMHFWTAFAFAHLFTCLECIRCALAGMYADVPFVCDAAYIQMPYD